MPSKTELFLDDQLLEMTASVTRKIHQPTKHRLNPVIQPEHWWEGNCVFPMSTLYDRDEKVFKTWYRTGPLDMPEKLDGHASYTAYATSTDGVHWEKPHLGAVSIAGRKDHNVVLISEGTEPRHAAQGKKAFIRSVIPHPNPRDESEKYVCMYFDMNTVGAYLAYSPDGIHWRKESKPFWRTLTDVGGWGDDSLISMIYDKFKKRWAVYRRLNPQESERFVAQPGDENWPRPDRGMRVMGYANSPDLKRWENFQMLLAKDADDPADVEFYGFTPYIYEQVYIGYLWVYHMAPDNETIDIQLTTSRDGTNFTRCCRRETFIPNGPADYFDHELVIGDQHEPIIVNDQVYIFYEACNYKHNDDFYRPHSRITGGLCTLPRDRFVSLCTGVPQPCRVVTRPMIVEYPKLFLNAATWGEGSIQVEVLGRDWLPISGFTAGDSNVIKGNALNHAVLWNGGGLGKLLGKEIRLKFNMIDARIHAMTFDTDDRPPKPLPPLAATGAGYAELPVDV